MNQHLMEEYIIEVQKHIRWKRAKKIATYDLEEHIQDQTDAYINEGMESNLALKKAIESMGNPKTIGEELNCAYKPKVNVPLIELTTAFLFLGLVVNYLSGSSFGANSFLAIGIGLFSAVALYFFDYTVFIRHPLAVYTIHLIVSVCIFAFEARNGINCIGYNYAFYSLLLFPISLSLMALYLKEKNEKYGLALFTVFTVPPFLLSFLIKSIPAITIILTIYFLITIYGIKRKWFILSYQCCFLTMILFIVVLTTIYGVSLIFNISFPDFISKDSFIQEKIIDSINLTEFYGSGDYQINSAIEKMLLEKYPFVLFLQKYGYFWVGFILLIFIILLSIMASVFYKQKTEIGKITAWITFFIITFQFLSSIICNFAYFGELYTNIPFFASGGVFTVIDLILIGINLSVSRNEDIVKEWIKQKTRRS